MFGACLRYHDTTLSNPREPTPHNPAEALICAGAQVRPTVAGSAQGSNFFHVCFFGLGVQGSGIIEGYGVLRGCRVHGRRIAKARSPAP